MKNAKGHLLLVLAGSTYFASKTFKIWHTKELDTFDYWIIGVWFLLIIPGVIVKYYRAKKKCQ